MIQGGKLSPILFNYLYEDIRIKTIQKWVELGKEPNDLHFELFADDLLIILRNYKETHQLMRVLKEAYEETQLQINENKTKVMLIGK